MIEELWNVENAKHLILPYGHFVNPVESTFDENERGKRRLSTKKISSTPLVKEIRTRWECHGKCSQLSILEAIALSETCHGQCSQSSILKATALGETYVINTSQDVLGLTSRMWL